jgi:hypothetical protein
VKRYHCPGCKAVIRCDDKALKMYHPLPVCAEWERLAAAFGGKREGLAVLK